MIFNLAYDWNYFYFSFIRWRFVFQTKILGNLLEVYFLFFYLILIIPSSLRCRRDQFAVYIFLAYCQLTAETLSEALKGGGGGWGRRWAYLFQPCLMEGGGGRLNWEVSLFNNGPIHALQSQVTKIGRKTTSALGSQNTLLTRPGRNKIGQN